MLKQISNSRNKAPVQAINKPKARYKKDKLQCNKKVAHNLLTKPVTAQRKQAHPKMPALNTLVSQHSSMVQHQTKPSIELFVC